MQKQNPVVEIVISKKIKTVHPLVESIITVLSNIDVIKFIRVTPDFIKASSEVTGTRIKTPITEPGHPSAVGLSVVIEPDFKTIQFHELNSAQKGYGEQMVSSILSVLPDDWNGLVVMDYSDGFWDKMAIRYPNLEIL